MKRTFKLNDEVRIKDTVRFHVCPKGRINNKTARIQAFLDGVYADGGVYLDSDLKGCRYWNIEDLEYVGK